MNVSRRGRLHPADQDVMKLHKCNLFLLHTIASFYSCSAHRFFLMFSPLGALPVTLWLGALRLALIRGEAPNPLWLALNALAYGSGPLPKNPEFVPYYECLTKSRKFFSHFNCLKSAHIDMWNSTFTRWILFSCLTCMWYYQRLYEFSQKVIVDQVSFSNFLSLCKLP